MSDQSCERRTATNCGRTPRNTRPDAPAFVIGVTGNMDLLATGACGKDLLDELRATIRTIFGFLRGDPEASATFRYTLAHSGFAQGLEGWKGLPPSTPIIVLTSIAPGADSLVAEVALEPKLAEQRIVIQAPLPFPAEIYARASTFNPPDAGAEQVRTLQSTYNALRRLVASRDEDAVYPVLMESDLELPATERANVFNEDVNDSARSRRRYQAAGEHIAARCDLLLAIWDDDLADESPAGTFAVVEAKYAGPTSGDLPDSTALAWTDSGTIFHIHARRRKVADREDPTRQARIRIIHPRLPKKSEMPLRERLKVLWDAAAFQHRHGPHAIWMREGNRNLARILHLLDEFNQTPEPCAEDMYREARARSGCQKTDTSLPDALLGSNRARFLHLCRAHRRAGDEADKLGRSKLKAIQLVFVLTLAAAMLVHVFSHWHLPESMGHHAGSGFRIGLAAGALILAFAAIGWFALQRCSRCESKAHDYRALAEGLRVQIAWCLAGLPRAVTANYMQRQRGELDWIRTAISSIASPLHPWRDWFEALTATWKVEALRRVKASWIDEQAGYFRRTTGKRREDLHFFHKFGGVLALVGCWHLVVLLLHEVFDIHAWIERRHTLLVLLGVGFIAALKLLLRRATSDDPGRSEREDSDEGRRAVSLKSLLVAFKGLFLRFLDGADIEHELSRGRRWLAMGRNFALQAGIGFVLFLGVLRANALLACALEPCPGLTNLCIITMGFFLVCGALSVAWAERKLLSEEAYQYNAMAQLFTNGQVRLERLLAELEREDIRPEDFDRHVREAQALIHALGREALAENAEWLILHRARPMEPVVPG